MSDYITQIRNMKKLPAGDAFSTARVWQVMKHYITLHRKSWEYTVYLILAAILLIYVLIFSLASPEIIVQGAGDEETGIQQWYILLGCVLSSRLFMEIHKPGTGWQLLSLPASPLEKFTAAWMIAVPFYTLLALGVGLLLLLIKTGVSLIYLGELIDTQLSVIDLLRSFGFYLIWSSIFLWGATYFRSLHFIKTAAGVLGIIILFFGSLGLLLYVTGWSESLRYSHNLSDNVLYDLMKYGLMISFTLLMLYLGYERLTKAEVRP